MSLKYITITSIPIEQLGSQMGHFAMLFLIAQKTGHKVGIYNSFLNIGYGQKLFAEAFDSPAEIISDDIMHSASPLYWETTLNTNWPKQDDIFELNSDTNYNVCAGLIHYNFLYYIDNQSIEYLRQNVFNFKQEIRADSYQYFNAIKSQDKKIVSVHVRRKDHCTLSPEYQKEAIKLFNPEKYKILLHSDDIGFCREEFKECLANYEVVYSDNTGPVDMHLMTLCDANIISDSTFSLWGALLNDAAAEMIMPRSLLPTVMDLEEIIAPLKKIRVLSW